MDASDWIAVVSAVGAVAAAAVAAFATFSDRKDARESAKSAQKSQEETKRQVEASQRIADFAEQTFAASSRPIIVSDAVPDPPFKYLREAPDVRNSWSRGDFAAYIQYPIRNIGVGPAMIVSVKMTIITDKYDKTSTEYEAHTSMAAMAPSVSGLMQLLEPTLSLEGVQLIDSLERAETLTAEISYTDIGAKRQYLTRFVLKPRTHSALKSFPGSKNFCDFSLLTTEIYECDEQGKPKDLPIASTNRQIEEPSE